MTKSEIIAVCADVIAEYLPKIKKAARVEVSEAILAELSDLDVLNFEESPESDNDSLGWDSEESREDEY